MVAILSCDHHDAAGLVPSTRSRATVLRQLQAAIALSGAIRAAFVDGRIRFIVCNGDAAAIVPVDASVTILQAWLVWCSVEPADPDALADPVVLPAEIRVPPEAP